jgi:flavin-dependent dehydrogenase
MAPWSDVVEVYWSDRGEGYVTPVAADLVGVAVLGPAGRSYQDWLADFPELAGHLVGREPASQVRGAGPMRAGSRRRVLGRALLVGDAAGYLDALTGEGIAIGLACSRELVAALVAGRPERYEMAWHRATRRYRVLTGGLLWAAGRPTIRRAIVPAAHRLPRVFSMIVNQLG